MQTIIDKSVYLSAKSSYKKLCTVGTLAKKLQAVMAAYQHGIKDTCRIMNVSRTSIYLWSKQIKQRDFDGLLNKSKHQDEMIPYQTRWSVNRNCSFAGIIIILVNFKLICWTNRISFHTSMELTSYKIINN